MLPLIIVKDFVVFDRLGFHGGSGIEPFLLHISETGQQIVKFAF
jgi:hypothetical protein